MKQIINIFLMTFMFGACTSPSGSTAPQALPTVETPLLAILETPTVLPTLTNTQAAPTMPVDNQDVFSQMGLNLPAPVCDSLTLPQMEGPYYKAGSPERNSLVEAGMDGTRLLLAGYVVDQNCQPLPHAWLDFWQADASGTYDNNDGYRLRGHQYTDAKGRFYLETILPGLYASRPIEHIHVKVQPEGGEAVTSQLYFPDRPVDGLTVTVEDRGDLLVGYFNFVLQK